MLATGDEENSENPKSPQNCKVQKYYAKKSKG